MSAFALLLLYSHIFYDARPSCLFLFLASLSKKLVCSVFKGAISISFFFFTSGKLLPCSVSSLTQDEVQLALRLKGVVERDQEGGLADVLQHLPLSASVLRRLGLLNDSCLLQHLGERQETLLER